MDLDDLLRSGHAMQAVHVLRQHPHAGLLTLQICNHIMRSVRLRAATVGLDLSNVAPRDLRVAGHHVTRQRLLDGQSFLGEALVIQASNASIGGQAGIRGNARPRNDQHPLCITDQRRDLIQFAITRHIHGHTKETSTRQS
ncbi:hypothetical protein SDC9_141876 [bioreactor metagenome]|uniref:Uncharacterized protein n=1 Tax=bioreactor metagenome TaxID=1076179 RepID=A0A645E026_9ZZZZ